MRQPRRGFTLIELLIVISVIAILISMLVVSYAAIKKQARDSKRISDISQLQTALESYFEDPVNAPTNSYGQVGVSQYPNPTSNPANLAALLNKSGSVSYIPSLPTDPSSGLNYDYYAHQETSGDETGYYQNYCLGAKLENSGSQASAEQSAQASCTGISWCPYIVGSPGYNNPNNDNYVVCR